MTMTMTLAEFAPLGRPLRTILDYDALTELDDPTEFDVLLADACAAASNGTSRLVGPYRTHQWDWTTVDHHGRTIGRISLSEWHPDSAHDDGGEWRIIGVMIVMPLDGEVGMVWVDCGGRSAPVYVAADDGAIAAVLAPKLPKLTEVDG
jgi:hypothetical protein